MKRIQYTLEQKEIKEEELTKENKLELIIDMVQAGISPEKIVIAIKELLL